MKARFVTQTLVSALALSGAIAFKAEAAPMPTVVTQLPTVIPSGPTVTPAPRPPQPQTTTFSCVSSGSGYATVVSKGVKQATLITWNSTSFGPEYTPQMRCNNVSQKFQTMVNRNGGKLSNLLLTVGSINGQTVVCAVNQGQYGCNQENMLFTLNQENTKNPGSVLATLLQIGNYGSGPVIRETPELPEFNLEEVVNQKLSNSAQVVTPEQPYASPTEVPSGNSGGSGF